MRVALWARETETPDQVRGPAAPLLAVGHPDVLDLRGAGQERAALAFGAGPVAGGGVFGPGLLEVAGGGARPVAVPPAAPKYQSGGDVVVLGHRVGQRVAVAGDDVDDAARHVGGVEHLVEVAGGQRLAGDGVTTTRLPMAIAGMTSETKPSSGASSGQEMPITPKAR